MFAFLETSYCASSMPTSADDIHLAQVCILLSSVGTVVHGFSFQALAKIQVELTSQGELSIPTISDRLDRCQVQTQQKLEGRCTGHAAASNMGVSVCETSNFDSFGKAYGFMLYNMI